MDFNNENDLKEAKKGILDATKKACAIIRARKLKLSKKQKEVVLKVINNNIGSALDVRTELSLLKKGYIVKKQKHVGLDDSFYFINF